MLYTTGKNAADCLEPATMTPGAEKLEEVSINPEHVQLSIACSLKRIADALTSSPVISSNIDTSATANLEQLAWTLGRSFEQGRRTDR